MIIPKEIAEKARKKALQSHCNQKIAALGFNRNKDCVASTTNHHRFDRLGGGEHAEMILMRQAQKKGIITILICRVGRRGTFLPIHPCPTCSKKAIELGIKILTIEED